MATKNLEEHCEKLRFPLSEAGKAGFEGEHVLIESDHLSAAVMSWRQEITRRRSQSAIADLLWRSHCSDSGKGDAQILKTEQNLLVVCRLDVRSRGTDDDSQVSCSNQLGEMELLGFMIIFHFIFKLLIHT